MKTKKLFTFLLSAAFLLSLPLTASANIQDGDPSIGIFGWYFFFILLIAMPVSMLLIAAYLIFSVIFYLTSKKTTAEKRGILIKWLKRLGLTILVVFVFSALFLLITNLF